MIALLEDVDLDTDQTSQWKENKTYLRGTIQLSWSGMATTGDSPVVQLIFSNDKTAETVVDEFSIADAAHTDRAEGAYMWDFSTSAEWFKVKVISNDANAGTLSAVFS